MMSGKHFVKRWSVLEPAHGENCNGGRIIFGLLLLNLAAHLHILHIQIAKLDVQNDA